LFHGILSITYGTESIENTARFSFYFICLFVFTEPLNSKDRDRLMGGINETHRSNELRCHDINTHGDEPSLRSRQFCSYSKFYRTWIFMTLFTKALHWSEFWARSMQFIPPHPGWIHCYKGMARPQVADEGDGLQIWRVAANILNKQSPKSAKEWYSSFGVGHGARNLSP
jgi:hypothetical protein